MTTQLSILFNPRRRMPSAFIFNSLDLILKLEQSSPRFLFRWLAVVVVIVILFYQSPTHSVGLQHSVVFVQLWKSSES